MAFRALFEEMPGVSTQHNALPSGWSWWSTYIEQDDMEGLTMLEGSLGGAGLRIQSKGSGYVDYFEYNGTGYWYGTLNAVSNEQMYMIHTSAACSATMTGGVSTFAGHPITITPGWNWIGFPSTSSIGLGDALGGFTPEANDQVKSKSGGYSTYVVYGNSALWYGTLNTLEPGQGYMYKSNATGNKTLVYESGRGETPAGNTTAAGNTYRPEETKYAHNMTVTAVIELEGEELRTEGYELAAFAGEECRGSARLTHAEPLGRHMAFLLVSGDAEEELRFVLSDGERSSWSPDRIRYTVDGIAGTPTEPVVLRFGPLAVDEGVQDAVVVYPNPSEDVFNVEGNGILKVEVTNAYGQAVYVKETRGNYTQVDLSGHATGVYLLKVVTDSGTVTRQMIKK